ncbi:hypothetical protein WA158_005550 [Blastocystis sp. Blastoise]
MSSSESDNEYNNDDMEFDDEFGRFASVMNDMNLEDQTNELPSKRKKRNMDDEEEEYEKVPRTLPEQTTREVHRLPLKLSDGQLKTFKPIEKEINEEEEEKEEEEEEEEENMESESDMSSSEDDEDDEEEEEEEEDMKDNKKNKKIDQNKKRQEKKRKTDDEEEEEEEEEKEEEKLETKEPPRPLTPEEIQQKIENHFEKCKVNIAELAISLMEDPEGNIRRRRNAATPLQQLIQLCYDDDKRVSLLALMSCYKVFDDVLPSYYIRELTQEEKDQKLTKDVRKQRQYEESLVVTYRSYLKALKTLVGTPSSQNPNIPKEITENGLRCLCSLLRYHYMFNYVEILTELVLPWVKSKYASYRRMCIESLLELFKHDAQGGITFDIVHQITAVLKQGGYNIQPEVLDMFISLPLKEKLDENTILGQKTKRQKSSEIDKIIKEGEGPDISLRKSFQKDTLQEVFVTYFRILKSNTKSALIPSVLHGLSKFGHLLNTDVVIDLLKLLKTQLERNDLSLDSSLYCIKTCFKLLQGPGAVLNLDEGVYINQLYKLFPQMILMKNEQYIDLFLENISYSFVVRKELLSSRVAAFIKQLFILSLNLQGKYALASISLARQLFLLYPQFSSLIQNEDGRVASGMFNITAEVSEHSNAPSATCWEIPVLLRSYNPDIQSFTKQACAFNTMGNKESWNYILNNETLPKIFQGEMREKDKKYFILPEEEGEVKEENKVNMKE